MESVTRSEPRLSIGMPVYNGERYLRAAIDSLLCQTFGDFELIISDNASTDSTPDICRTCAALDPRIRYEAQPVNRGATWNVNHVLTLARAKYFKWAHADDLYAPRYLECCIAELDRASSPAIVVCSRGIIIDENDRQICPYEDRWDLRQSRPSDRLRLAAQNVGGYNVQFGVMRTHVLRACRPEGSYPYGDIALANELVLRGQIWEIPDPLFYRRVHPENSLRPDWTTMETAVYLDPRNRGNRILPRCQAFLDSLRAIREVGLPPSEVIRCRVALLRGWPRIYWREMRRELRDAARAWLRIQIDRRWGEGSARALKSSVRRWLGRSHSTGRNAETARTSEEGHPPSSGSGPAVPP